MRNFLLAVLLLVSTLAAQTPSTHTVKVDGTGSFTTIHACAIAAQPGDTCLVSPGTYPERVRPATSGITFKADGLVITQGFDIRYPFTTVDGFDFTGFTTPYQGLVDIREGGDDCRIVNNTFRDGSPNVYGINFRITNDAAASRCVVENNLLDNLQGTFLTTAGSDHLFQGNKFERQNSRDLIRLFGSNHVFRRNIFWKGTTISGVGNHPDFVQTFGGAGPVQNILFEENWIQNLESQFSQMNSGDGNLSNGIVYDNVKDITFRRNLIANVSNNANIIVPGVRFEHNTFYRLSYLLSGIGYGGSLVRGDASRGFLQNNIFLDGGASTGSGFYSLSGANFTKEVIAFLITDDPTRQGPTTTGIFDDLNSNGYINPNGVLLDPAKALTSPDQFVFSEQYAEYRTLTYDLLTETVQLDAQIRNTFVADYNAVSPAKRSDQCVGGVTDRNFCEPHGINGGDFQLQDVSNPLGPDGTPFTLDDGLKPIPTSPLCTAGVSGADIGVYSCDPFKVFPGDSTGITHTVKADGSGDFTTIAACAKAVKAGETCLVFAGVYPEHVSTVVGGTEGKPVTFRASGVVTMKGFRLKHPYVRVEGFDITKYVLGLDQAHIRVEPEADHCQIVNNTVRDGVYLTSSEYFFDGPTRTITNPSGGFLAAGFIPGASIYIASSINDQILNHDNNKGDPYAYETKVIKEVTDTTITLIDSNTVFTEGPVQSTIYVNTADKNGVWAIQLIQSSTRGTPNNCLIQGNRFSNLASRAVLILGDDHIFERNTFERMNGWRMLTFLGSRHQIRHNVFLNSPRWPGFPLPDAQHASQGGGTWDMYDSIFVSSGGTANDNVFEYNFVLDVDAQFANVQEEGSYGLIIRHNVFVGYELTGALSRPGTQVVNNTFYRTAWNGSLHNFNLAKSQVHGNPVDSLIQNNVFIETAKASDPTSGWYSITGYDGLPTPGVTADYNFVTGTNGASKSGFVEPNGINGGSPQVRDAANPLGPDGIPFTVDDGLKPLSTSPLCGSGASGADRGAYSCDSGKVFP